MGWMSPHARKPHYHSVSYLQKNFAGFFGRREIIVMLFNNYFLCTQLLAHLYFRDAKLQHFLQLEKKYPEKKKRDDF